MKAGAPRVSRRILTIFRLPGGAPRLTGPPRCNDFISVRPKAAAVAGRIGLSEMRQTCLFEQ